MREDAFVNLWHISEDTFNPELKHLHSQETVYTVGNGYFCTRGTFEEGYPKANPATLLYGVFDSIPIAKEELANAPDWTSVGLSINGERFRLDKGKILDYNRTLDMQNGLLQRSIHWETPKGIRLKITSERFASLADEHVGAIRYTVTNEDSNIAEPLEIGLWANFHIAVGNYDLMHWETVDQGFEQEILWLQSETKKSGVQLAQTMTFTTTLPGCHTEYISSYIAPSIRTYGKLPPGETMTTEKIVVMYTTRDGVIDPVHAAVEYHRDLVGATAEETAQTYEQLLEKHREEWQKFWQTADVIIEGDVKSQLGIRYNIYQLRINASAHDSRYSIAAKGLTGFGYRGHIFHDTEIFMLPFFTYVQPDFARLLLMYRYHLLPAARKKAASNGYEGAQYPWESTLNGEETTPSSIIHPETGEVIPVLNGFIELHITASIAHAVQHYWEITGDDDFMRDYGAEIVLSGAIFWGSRAEKNEGHGDYEITNVIGPDEWHEHVNNNAFTNYMARDNILNALKDLHWLKTTAPAKARELVQQLNLNSERLERWQDIAKNIRIPQDPKTKVFEQFDGFFKLEILDQSQFEGRKDSFQGIMGIHAVQKYQIIKQADVLMLLTVLDQQFDLETRRANWDYYYPLTDHDYGSSLSPAFHVQLACELGLSSASYKQFLLGALVDLENLRGNTPEGIHTACAGAVWQAAIFGFAGLRVTEEGYTTSPSWPDGWTRLAFKFKHKGQLIEVDLHK